MLVSSFKPGIPDNKALAIYLDRANTLPFLGRKKVRISRLNSNVEEFPLEEFGTKQKELVGKFLSVLKDKREVEVIKLRFAIDTGFPPLTLEQIGKIYKVTRERVRQIQNAGLKEIRSFLEANPEAAKNN